MTLPLGASSDLPDVSGSAFSASFSAFLAGVGAPPAATLFFCRGGFLAGAFLAGAFLAAAFLAGGSPASASPLSDAAGAFFAGGAALVSPEGRRCRCPARRVGRPVCRRRVVWSRCWWMIRMIRCRRACALLRPRTGTDPAGAVRLCPPWGAHSLRFAPVRHAHRGWTTVKACHPGDPSASPRSAPSGCVAVEGEWIAHLAGAQVERALSRACRHGPLLDLQASARSESGENVVRSYRRCVMSEDHFSIAHGMSPRSPARASRGQHVGTGVKVRSPFLVMRSTSTTSAARKASTAAVAPLDVHAGELDRPLARLQTVRQGALTSGGDDLEDVESRRERGVEFGPHGVGVALAGQPDLEVLGLRRGTGGRRVP